MTGRRGSGAFTALAGFITIVRIAPTAREPGPYERRRWRRPEPCPSNRASSLLPLMVLVHTLPLDEGPDYPRAGRLLQGRRDRIIGGARHRPDSILAHDLDGGGLSTF